MEQIRRLNAYLREKYNKKIYKIALSASTTCPNRDGRIGTGGCIFCSGGSGEFSVQVSLNVDEEIKRAIERISSKVNEEAGYIAYFQAYTGTYGDLKRLESIYTQAAKNPYIEALSIGTRPDCLDDDVMDMLIRLNNIKPLMIELGLQTSKKESVDYIRRGYDNQVYEEAVSKLRSQGIEVVVHIILGLPYETKEDMLNTIRYINKTDIQGVKLQLLHILEGTDMAFDYEQGKFDVLSLEEYGDILCEALEELREDIIVHRLTGDGAKKLLIAPKWSGDKKRVLNYINTLLRDRNVIQGRRCK